MGLSNVLGRYKVPRTTQNHPAWNGRRAGHYEVWYLTLNAPGENAGFWFRYTLDAPVQGEPHGELWGNFFDGAAPDRTFGLRSRFEGADFDVGTSPLIHFGHSAELDEGAAFGILEGDGHRLKWDLQFTTSPTAFWIAPAWLRGSLARKGTNWGVPHMDVRFTGTIVADGHTFELRDAPGQQAHLFGHKHADRWAWAHCNVFDGAKSALLEGVAVEAVLAGKRRLMTLLYLRYDGRDYFCNALPGPALRARSELRFPSWEFHCDADGTEFYGVVRGAPERMLQVRYEDPDGTPSYCCNSEVGDLRLEVKRGGQVVDVLTATGTAHLEFGERERRDGVRLGLGP